MTKYTHRGDKADWASYHASYEHVAKVSKKGSELRAKMVEIEDAIAKGQEDFDKADRDAMQLKKQLANAEANRTTVEERNAMRRAERAKTIELTEEVTAEFEKAKQDRNKAKEVYLNSIPTAQRKPIVTPPSQGRTTACLMSSRLVMYTVGPPVLPITLLSMTWPTLPSTGFLTETMLTKSFPMLMSWL